MLLAAADGLSGFQHAITAVFVNTKVQHCIIHQIRHSLKYVSWKDRKPFFTSLKGVYQAPAREQAEASLARLEESWGGKYASAVRSWQNNWAELATFFESPKEIHCLIYTTNSVEGYHRQLRMVIKTKGSFPSEQAARRLLYLVTVEITENWSAPIRDWPLILNQLAIRFADRLSL